MRSIPVFITRRTAGFDCKPAGNEAGKNYHRGPGLSKTYAMTGWRMGYGVMPEWLVDAVNKLMVTRIPVPPVSHNEPPSPR